MGTLTQGKLRVQMTMMHREASSHCLTVPRLSLPTALSMQVRLSSCSVSQLETSLPPRRRKSASTQVKQIPRKRASLPEAPTVSSSPSSLAALRRYQWPTSLTLRLSPQTVS